MDVNIIALAEKIYAESVKIGEGANEYEYRHHAVDSFKAAEAFYQVKKEVGK